MGKAIIIKPNITPEEKEENLKQIIALLESIAQEIQDSRSFTTE